MMSVWAMPATAIITMPMIVIPIGDTTIITSATMGMDSTISVSGVAGTTATGIQDMDSTCLIMSGDAIRCATITAAIGAKSDITGIGKIAVGTMMAGAIGVGVRATLAMRRRELSAGPNRMAAGRVRMTTGAVAAKAVTVATGNGQVATVRA